MKKVGSGKYGSATVRGVRFPIDLRCERRTQNRKPGLAPALQDAMPLE